MALFQHLSPEAWDRRGIANGKEVSVRALAFVIAGHAAHHLQILRERYLG
ncbi:DinB family protein [Erwinia amylovora]